MIIPEYAENIIVGIQDSNNFNWYILYLTRVPNTLYVCPSY